MTTAPAPGGERTTHGRAGAGYGGFFWRLPSFSQIHVRTAGARGEGAVHGHPAAWLVVQGRVRADDAEVTLVFRGADAPTRCDPWFVRLEGYPGIGSSLAVERPLALAPGAGVRRAVDVVLFDGRIPVPDAVAAGAVPGR